MMNWNKDVVKLTIWVH